MNRDQIVLSLRRFKEMNQEKYDIIKIGLFGSAARGSMIEESDIDVVVELGKPDLFNLIGIKH
jgi:predicted nucleotidyltransferase